MLHYSLLLECCVNSVPISTFKVNDVSISKVSFFLLFRSDLETVIWLQNINLIATVLFLIGVICLRADCRSTFQCKTVYTHICFHIVFCCFFLNPRNVNENVSERKLCFPVAVCLDVMFNTQEIVWSLFGASILLLNQHTVFRQLSCKVDILILLVQSRK